MDVDNYSIPNNTVGRANSHEQVEENRKSNAREPYLFASHWAVLWGSYENGTCSPSQTQYNSIWNMLHSVRSVTCNEFVPKFPISSTIQWLGLGKSRSTLLPSSFDAPIDSDIVPNEEKIIQGETETCSTDKVEVVKSPTYA